MKKIYFVLSLVLILSGCQKESLPLTVNEKNDFSQLEKDLSLSEFPDELIRQTLKVDWNKFSKIDNASIEFYTNLNNTLENEMAALFYKYSIILKQNGGQEPHFQLLKYISPNDNLQNTSLNEMGNFTGGVTRYNLEGEILEMSSYENGILKSKIKGELIPDPQTKRVPPMWDEPGVSHYVQIRTELWQDNWSRASVNGNITSIYYRGSSLINVRTEWVPRGSVPPAGTNNTGDNTYHGHYDAPHGPSGNGNPHNYEEEEGSENADIIESLDKWDALNDNINIHESIYEYDCLTEVLNEVLALNDNLVDETINQFCGNDDYKLTFTKGECARTDDACTNGANVDTTGEVIIKIEDPSMNSISLASAILHEGVHAEIFRFVNEHHHGYVDPNDKPQLFDYFERYAGTEWEEEIDHIYMTRYYIEPIANALRNLDNNKYNINYYKTFAWDGLRAWDPDNSLGITDEEYGQYRNEVTENFEIKCDD